MESERPEKKRVALEEGKKEQGNVRKRSWFYHHLYTLIAIGLLVVIGAGISFFFWKRGDSQHTPLEVTIPKAEDGKFSAFSDQIFREWVQGTTIDLHYTLENPEDFGIEESKISWGEVSEEGMIAYYKQLEQVQNELSKFTYDQLTDEEKLTYDVLQQYLETELKAKDLYLYQGLLSPLTGIQSQAPIFLSEYSFKDEGDVKTYLELCKQLPDYFKQLIRFEKEKSKGGLFMSDVVLDEVIAQCKQFIADSSDNMLLSTFDERIGQMQMEEIKKQDYISQNKQIVSESIIPAYRQLINGLNEFRGTGTNEGGLCNYKNGAQYYEYMIASNTGTNLSAEELKNKISTAVFNDLSAAALLLQQDSGVADAAANAVYPSSDFNAILEELQQKIQSDFPELSGASCEIKKVNPSLQEYLSPAFYIPPPIDNTQENLIYINENPDYDLTKIYPTIAHEGYPGHLYQNVYFRQNNSVNLRKILNFPGYTEGWAVYCEYKSYSMMETVSAPVQSYLQHVSAAALGIHALMDIGIHYDGWDMEQVGSYVGNYFGELDEDSIRELYYNIVEEPANYLSYYVGYLEILDLKEQAETLWQDSFTLKKFHQRLLDIGPAPFDVISKYLSE